MRLKFAFMLAIASVLITAAPALAQQRKSITALTAAEVQSLRNGFAQMIAWNSAPRSSPEFRRSLQFWANMHAYFGQNCAPTSGLSNPGMSGLSVQTPTTPEEFATWCTCRHGDIHFLTWHRMYVYFFEQVLRTAANDPNLTLPFWDYQTNGALPAAFRAPTYVNSSGQTVANPLYVANRQAALNAGTGSLTAAVTSTSAAMALTDYPTFNSSIENTPHGAVHCATGVSGCSTGIMGSVPAAGNDPIFYTHHANIDRLYSCWLGVAPDARAPAVALRSRSFTFIDGTGAQVTRTVGDMMTTSQLGYSYAGGGGCPLRLIRIPPLQRVWKWKFIPPGPLRTEAPVVLPQAELLRARRARVTELVLDDPQIGDSPTGLVEVALVDARGRSATLGVVSAFNMSAPMHDHGAGEMGSRELRFDASAALKQVGAGARVVVRPAAGVESINKSLTITELEVRGKPVSLRTKGIRLESR